MEDNQRQKKVAGHCALVMCGSIACAGLRTTKLRDIERFFTFQDERDANARKHDTLVHEQWGDAHCVFQDVCKRLEMVVRLRDLYIISNEVDNRAYNRNERMGVCDARTDDHERKELEMDAACECADDSHGCDDAGDSMGDSCLELWAGADDLVGRGTNLEYKVKIKINEESNAMFDRIMRTEQGIMIKKQLKDSFEDFLIYGYEKTWSKN